MAAEWNPKDEYENGYVGCRFDPRAHELFVDSIMRCGGDPDGGRNAKTWGLEGAGAGRLTMTWLHVESVFPGCWPGPAQVVGDCVSKGVSNALLTSMACEIVSGLPDEETGRVEVAPQLSAAGIKNIPIASESLYWWRSTAPSDGWFCAEAAQIATTKGFLVRREYPDLGIDLTRYTKETVRKFSRRPPDKIADEQQAHRARTATVLKQKTEVRDYLACGYGVFFCAGLSWSDVRDEWGFSPETKKGWGHSQCAIGYDERPETVRKYGQPLVAILNSWARWNSGPRRVYGTNYDLPEGAYWSLSSCLDRCSCIALSSVVGWPRHKLPSYGADTHI